MPAATDPTRRIRLKGVGGVAPGQMMLPFVGQWAGHEMMGGGELSPARLRVDVVAGEDVDLVVAAGEVDVTTNLRLARALHRLGSDCDRAGAVDLRKVRFMDGAGVQLLLNLQRRLARQGQRLTVMCARGPVYRTLESLDLVETLNVACSPAHLEGDAEATAWATPRIGGD
jgi:anti-anti-sigma factor